MVIIPANSYIGIVMQEKEVGILAQEIVVRILMWVRPLRSLKEARSRQKQVVN